MLTLNSISINKKVIMELSLEGLCSNRGGRTNYKKSLNILKMLSDTQKTARSGKQRSGV